MRTSIPLAIILLMACDNHPLDLVDSSCDTALKDERCGEKNKTCGDCSNTCELCSVLRCDGSKWIWIEYFPSPACHQDAGVDTGSADTHEIHDARSETLDCDAAAEDLACSQEGAQCGGGGCTSPCQHCNSLFCQGGIWTRLEAYPHPRCCGSSLCESDEYCLAQGCGAPGCEPELPECKPLPAGCSDCSCLEAASCICSIQSGDLIMMECPGA